MRKQLTMLIIALTLLAFPCHVYAYLDPGTGSYFFQIIMAVIFSSLLLIKIWFKNIKAFFVKLFSRKPGADGKNK